MHWLGDEQIAMLIYPGMTVMDLIGPHCMFAGMMGRKGHGFELEAPQQRLHLLQAGLERDKTSLDARRRAEQPTGGQLDGVSELSLLRLPLEDRYQRGTVDDHQDGRPFSS